MVLIKANRLHFDARHASEQFWQDLSYISTDARIQDPAAVFANPEESIYCERSLCIPWRQYTTPGLIHPRVNPWYSVFDRIKLMIPYLMRYPKYSSWLFLKI